MVAEIRDGLLYIYLPPTEELEHFVDLISRVEAAAAKADCPVVIEGYGPPADPRLTSMTITPTPLYIFIPLIFFFPFHHPLSTPTPHHLDDHHPRPRRHRGQRRALVELRRTDSNWKRCTSKRG